MAALGIGGVAVAAAGLAIGFGALSPTGQQGSGDAGASISAGDPVPGSFLPIVATTGSRPVELFASRSSTTPEKSWPPRNSLGVSSVFLVKEITGSWLDVYVPERPNGSTAWVRSAQVSLARDPYKVVDDVTTHRVTVTDGSKTILIASAASGQASTPTPEGTWFITELLKQPDPGGAYGPYAYGLSAFSKVLFHFAGGPGQIGFHGTNEPGSIGKASSHGCIRVSNSVISRLAPILPLGTPVIVKS